MAVESMANSLNLQLDLVVWLDKRCRTWTAPGRARIDAAPLLTSAMGDR